MNAIKIQQLAYLLAAALFVGMPLVMEIGRRVRQAHAHQRTSAGETGTGPLDAAVYALFGLLLAFVFSGAAARFDHRRALITEEANAIGTAWLRLDLLPAETQTAVRPLFRDYVESRIEMYQAFGDESAAAALYRRSSGLQQLIWDAAVAGAREAGSPAVLSLLVPALNAMFDISTTRLAATRTHPPMIVYVMLVLVALAASFLAGMSMGESARRPWPHIIAFTLVISATTYVILDIEVPRLGVIRIDAADALLIDLLETMKSTLDARGP
jgi:hypothetical protein